MTSQRTEQFSWRESGAGAQLPVLLLHGLMGSRRSWDAQLTGLSADRRVLAWDAPGYGGSNRCAASFAAFADAVLDFADSAGLHRFHLVGLSFGGMIAQHAALRHPDRIASLSLLSTSPKFGFDGVTTPHEWRAARLARLDAGDSPSDFAPAVLQMISGPNISPAALTSQVHAADLVSSDALRTAIDVLITHDTREVLAGISMPTLCIVGALDIETPVSYVEYIADRIPGAQLEVIDGAGHLLNAEAPEAVNDLLSAHFRSCDVAK